MNDEATIRQKLHALVQEQLDSADQESAMQEFDRQVEEGVEEDEAFNSVCESYDIDTE